jgi:hypothetical protein
MRYRSRASAILGVLMCGAAQAFAAQQPALFVAPPAVVDYERYYTTVEECLAAVGRVADSATWGDIPRTFALERWEEFLNAGDPRLPAPGGTVETARRCAAPFSMPAPAADLPLLDELWLDAAQDSLANAALQGDVALAPPDSSPRGQAQRLMKAVRFALEEARPARLELAERWLAQITRLGWQARLQRYGAYEMLWSHARTIYDTTRADRYVALLRALADSLPPTDPGHQYLVGMARAFDNIHRHMRALGRGETVQPMRPEPMPAIEADFWFGRTDSLPRPRPGRGRAGLVLFLEPDCVDPGSECFAVAALRDLHRRFGNALEITLVTHTHGYFRNHPPPTPAQEAELLRHYYLDYLGMPGGLAVQIAPFRRLPPPDRRRFDQLVSNVTRYGPWDLALSSNHSPRVDGFLVDGEGRAILRMDLFNRSDWWVFLEKAIEGYMKRLR